MLPYPAGTAVAAMGFTGVRVSEALGLKWKHVHFDGQKIGIEQAFRVGEIQHRCKTEKSRRDVPMSPYVAEELLAWKKESTYGELDDFVFASEI